MLLSGRIRLHFENGAELTGDAFKLELHKESQTLREAPNRIYINP